MRNRTFTWFVLSVVLLAVRCGLAQEPTRPANEKAHENLPPIAQSTAGGTEQTDEGTADDAFASKRRDWFEQQRAYPNAHIPEGARWQALEQRAAIEQAQRAVAKSSLAHPQDSFTSAVWTSVGPKPVAFSPTSTAFSGRATSIAINPTTPTTIYLGTAGGGVWKTVDGGLNWSPTTDQQASLAIGALAIDPVNPNVIYAGTGEPDLSGDSYYGQGLLKSTDAGATWTLIRTPFTVGVTVSDFSSIVLQPGNSSVVVASTLNGVYRSADAGATWARVLPLAVSSVIFDATNASTLYAGINGYYSGMAAFAAVYKSTDAGVTWTPVTGSVANPLPAASNVVRTTMAEDSTGTNLYAAIARSDFGSPGNLYRSTDGGANWTKLTSPSTNDGMDWYRDGFLVMPNTNPNVLYTGGVNIYQSLDGGITWKTLGYGGAFWADQHAFVASPDGSKMYVADDGGISVATGASALNPTFTSLNATISTMTFYPGFSIIPNQPNSALAGTQDHGLDIYNGVSLWTYGDNDRFCGDGGSAYVDPLNGHAYAHCQGGSANWVANASGANSVTTYVAAQTGIATTVDRLPWVADIKGDPENVAIVYTGTNHLYQSTNYAALWKSISPDLTNGSGIINTIGVSPTNSNVVYTGSNDGVVQMTTTAMSGTSATWTKLAGLPNRSITKIVVAQDSPQDVYVVVGGFGAGHVFRSTNGGTTFTDLSGNLPNSPVNSLLIDPSLANTLYVATDTGVYYTANNGTSWAILGTGLPNVVVADLLMYPATRTIRVITHGRGAWDVVVAAPTLTVSTPALSFVGQAVGTTSAAQTVTLNNGFATAVTIGTVAITGDFAQTNTCGTSLAGGASCSLAVTFSPSVTSARTGVLTIPSSAPTLSVTLSGAGVGGAVVSLSANSLTFAQAAGIASASKSVTLTNTGTGDLTGLVVSLTGTNASDFTQTSTCGSTVVVGANCTVSLVFTSPVVGARSATLSFADSATSSPQTVSLTGAGVAPFLLGAATTSATVSAGNGTSYNVQMTVAPGTTLATAVQMTCTGAPSLAICSATPASLAVGGASQVLTVNVTTTATKTGALIPGPLDRSRESGTVFALAGLLGFGLVARRRRRLLGVVMLLLFGLGSAAMVSGCSKSNSVSGPVTIPGTPAGTYTLTVTATTPIYQTTQNLTLIVQ